MYKVLRHQYLSESLWSGERDKGRERTFSHFFAQLVIWQLIFVISDRSICLKLTIRFLRLNFCHAWKLLKSLKITAQTADGENNKAKITFPENKF